MLTKERFNDLVHIMLDHNELYDKLYALGIDTINCKYLEYAGVFFDEIIRENFGPEGSDLILWWMYEDVDHKIYAPSDNQKEFYYPGEEIHGEVIADINEIDALYDYLVENYKDETGE